MALNTIFKVIRLSGVNPKPYFLYFIYSKLTIRSMLVVLAIPILGILCKSLLQKLLPPPIVAEVKLERIKSNAESEEGTAQ